MKRLSSSPSLPRIVSLLGLRWSREGFSLPGRVLVHMATPQTAYIYDQESWPFGQCYAPYARLRHQPVATLQRHHASALPTSLAVRYCSTTLLSPKMRMPPLFHFVARKGRVPGVTVLRIVPVLESLRRTTYGKSDVAWGGDVLVNQIPDRGWVGDLCHSPAVLVSVILVCPDRSSPPQIQSAFCHVPQGTIRSAVCDGDLQHGLKAVEG